MIAITTYYNPCGYDTRLKNFKTFKANLNLPLLTIELSFNGKFQLKKEDSNFLIRIQGDTILWQKERLLNIALKHIPKDFKYVAWLDCDVILKDPQWIKNSIQLLQNYKLIQPFSELIDLPRDFILNEEKLKQLNPTGHSISFLKASESASNEEFRPPTTSRLRKTAFGLAWVSSVNLLKKHGFYDAMIIGSGDRAMACAAYGHFKDVVFTTKLNSDRERHYMKWAKPFFNEINGNVGYLNSRLYHLWHGEIKDRNYIERHEAFSKFEFNPSQDLVTDNNGCWVLNGVNKEMESFFVNYFKSRKEDGIEI